MFVLANCIASLGHLVALFLLYKEIESVILIDTKSFSQSSECSFSLSLSLSLCMPSRLCMLSAIAELSSRLHFLFQHSIKTN